MDALAGITAQLEAMEAELLMQPDLPPKVRAYLHLQAARRALAEVGGNVGKRPPSGELGAPYDQGSWPSAAAASRGTGKVKRRMDPKRVMVLEQAANLIRGKLTPTKTAEIYDRLAENVRSLIGGDEPKSNLSAMLFHSPAFDSHGRAGWTLAEDRETIKANADSLAELMGSVTEDHRRAAEIVAQMPMQTEPPYA
jgi:hypothetical protein